MSSKPRTTSAAAAESKAPEAAEATKTTTTGATTAPAQTAQGETQAAEQGEGNVNVTGRSVFAIETTAAGVVVRTAFLTEDNRVLDMPAVFPDAFYAFNVIDDLKRQVAQHFSQAAKVGAQVIANQAQAQQAQAGQQATTTTTAAAQDASSDAEKKSA
ncbi:hypothetical protein SAMN05216526_0392 [Ectothiorhodosinus mongolicus]|uniref:Uncharacterized protein n=1 Tax=Ectothiorhodosinus mongolicus TaxID=233100 RepID=A0A1R3VN78_9GAMM|nr:hypothetical protein [Ectothiorhodosinus mongolicus]ULX56412.1 hypothetical protein CKX93_01030 [Ectothiorhodosinus mongolicus]SIT65934.1 hypothetical protein SAMN05216526_0392 [Ectothiorhodosinus mongolicus]